MVAVKVLPEHSFRDGYNENEPQACTTKIMKILSKQ